MSWTTSALHNVPPWLSTITTDHFHSPNYPSFHIYSAQTTSKASQLHLETQISSSCVYFNAGFGDWHSWQAYPKPPGKNKTAQSVISHVLCTLLPPQNIISQVLSHVAILRLGVSNSIRKTVCCLFGTLRGLVVVMVVGNRVTVQTRLTQSRTTPRIIVNSSVRWKVVTAATLYVWIYRVGQK